MMTDETLAGYVDERHGPPTFIGADGVSYSAEVYVDETPQEDGRFGAALLFVRWSRSDSRPDGHLETGYLAHGETPEQAKAAVEALSIDETKNHLNGLIETRKGHPGW